jgi:hypothetical protein
MLEEALRGAVFFDEMHNRYESGYSQGDPYGNAVINTAGRSLLVARDYLGDKLPGRLSSRLGVPSAKTRRSNAIVV